MTKRLKASEARALSLKVNTDVEEKIKKEIEDEIDKAYEQITIAANKGLDNTNFYCTHTKEVMRALKKDGYRVEYVKDQWHGYDSLNIYF